MYWQWFPNDQHQRATVIQIRYRGAKGVLSLDPTLRGELLHIRESMLKFESRADCRDLEICDTSSKPLPIWLNHQFIKILEDLGVHPDKFLEIHKKAIDRPRKVIQLPLDAARFLGRFFLDAFALL